MRFLKRLGMLIYALLMLSVGALFVLTAFSCISSDLWGSFCDVIAGNLYYQVAMVVVGAIFVIAGVMAPYRLGKKLKKDRVISFQNPDGEVSVSLSAIEEYIKKISKNIPGIKDIKSHVDVSKKGINIVMAVSLSAGSNIPEVTERIQMEVRNKVQGMLGVEERINIKMHISKIMRGAGEEPMPEEMPEAPQVPFGDRE